MKSTCPVDMPGHLTVVTAELIHSYGTYIYWKWILVCRITWRRYVDGVWEQGAEEDISALEGESKREMGKTVSRKDSWFVLKKYYSGDEIEEDK
jgi:hypothetical protein